MADDPQAGFGLSGWGGAAAGFFDPALAGFIGDVGVIFEDVAEVVRDLYRSESQPEQSYSERQLYEAALDRMSREIAAVNKCSDTEAIRHIEQNLAKSASRKAAAAATEDEDGEQTEAA